MAFVIAVSGLAGTAAFIALENTWAKPTFREPQETFFHGTIGTELMPLPVAHALPDLFPEHFQPGGPDQGDWIEQFGFLRSDAPENDGLPVGFTVSMYRPQSAAPSPVPFVGFSCVLCHSTVIQENENAPAHMVIGPGNVALNLFAYLDAFQAAVLDEDKLTVAAVEQTYQARKRRTLGVAEKAMVALWLRQFRGTLQEGLQRFDEPFGNGLSRSPEYVPTGPVRTQPFRTLIRRVLHRPGSDMAVYTKIATVFSEDLRPWSQFDGSIEDLNSRSSLAALAAGATVDNMAHPEIAHNIVQASTFTRTLRGPRYETLFPDQARQLRPERVERGRQVYLKYCNDCHGHRDEQSGGWVNGRRHAEVVPLAEIGTDPERVLFRHYDEIPQKLVELFPENHPFRFPRDKIRPFAGEEKDLSRRGYVNAPMDGMFLRGPFLHNASVLTLAELIHLKPRREVFYRGRNFYDPVDVGYRSPDQADARHYFRFDIRLRGNSNRGHDYPWRPDDPARNPNDLEALLEYLKTL